jgi:N-acetylmuramoyl-L-alanine amidase
MVSCARSRPAAGARFCAHPMVFRRVTAILSAALALTVGAGTVQARRTGPLRTAPIDMVVLHSTGGPTCDPLTNQVAWVGAGTLRANMRAIEAHPKLGIHYMIDRDGTVVTSIPEDQVAHHVFRFSGRSIGIELVNDGDGRDPFPAAQIASLEGLLRDIVRRRGIARAGVKRHSDLDHAILPCAPRQRRKVDPGAAFPFEPVLDRVFQPN